MRKKLTIDGINIYYKGNIQRGAVVFLHGNSLNGQVFSEQFRYIGAFPMLAIDLPGHGASARAADPREVYNIPAYARLVVRLVSELGLREVVLAGHALGANVAIEASESLPGLRGLFLFSMNPFSQPPRLDLMCRPHPLLGYLLGGRLRPMEALLLAEDMLPGNPALSDLLATWILQTDTAARMGLAASIGLDCFSDEFRILRCFPEPLAVLKGKSDPFINPRYLPEQIDPVSLWQNGIIELDAGHVPQMENYRQFNVLIQEFYRFCFSLPRGKRQHVRTGDAHFYG